MMSSIVSINLKSVQQILASNNLGAGTILEEGGQVRVFLDSEPTAVMAMHTAASQLEAATGRVVHLELKSNLGAAQLAQLERVGTVVEP
jgi:hypothetical protein